MTEAWELCGRCGGTGNDPDTSRDYAPPECRRCDGDGREPNVRRQPDVKGLGR